jgi:hypothetical protein
VVEFVVAIDEARVRFTDDALFFFMISFQPLTKREVDVGFGLIKIVFCFFDFFIVKWPWIIRS